MDDIPQINGFPNTPIGLEQLVLEGFTEPALQRSTRRQKQTIAETLAKLHQLHDELNAQLYRYPTERPAIHSAQDAHDILRCFLSNLDHEELWVLNLDTRNHLTHLVKLYQGSVNSSQVRVAEVFRAAIADNSPSILLGHNHPLATRLPARTM